MRVICSNQSITKINYFHVYNQSYNWINNEQTNRKMNQFREHHTERTCVSFKVKTRG